MFDELSSVLEQVAACHHTTAGAVRAEIASALSHSQADPALSPEEFIAFAALTALLSQPEPAAQ